MHYNGCRYTRHHIAAASLILYTVVNGYDIHASLSTLANTFSTTKLLLIEHLIYLKHFVLFNCLRLMFNVIVDFCVGL